jgi:membrane-associated PAP2 superfamily phosphatase
MNRTGLVIALVVAAGVGLVFGIWPDLDLKLAALFYDPVRGFWRAYDPIYLRARDVAVWLVTLVAVPAGLALALKFVQPRRPLIIPGRAIVLMLVTLALAPGVVANLVFKEHWGRPRPIDVAEFGGDEHFRPWWDPRGDCPKNCSFVAGEPSGAFWTLAGAAVVPPHWRALAYAKALAFGARAVMIGRAYLWALGANGQAGVENILDILRNGIDSTLLALGKSSIHELSPADLVIPRDFARCLGA